MASDHELHLSPVTRINLGAQMIQKRQFALARKSLILSLAEVSSDISRHENWNSTDQLFDLGVITFANCLGYDRTPPESICARIPIDEAPSSRFFNESPMFLPDSLELDPTNGQGFSYCVIYNLALSWHLESIVSTEKKDLYLVKAIELYKLAHSMLSSQWIHVPPLQLMTIICNTGHAFYAQGNESQANQYFGVLLSSILYTISRGGSADCIHNLKGFISNVSHLVLTQLTTPAA